MKNKITVLEPQTERETTAMEVMEWEFPLSGEGGQVIPVYEEEGTATAPAEYRAQEIRYTPVTEASRWTADWTVDTGYWVFIANVLWRVVQYAAPFVLVGAAIYGGYVLLIWLVEQTVFWIIVGAVSLVLVLGSMLFPGKRTGTEWKEPPRRDKAPGQRVITNVHVQGGQGPVDVQTNVFVSSTSQNQFYDDDLL